MPSFRGNQPFPRLLLTICPLNSNMKIANQIMPAFREKKFDVCLLQIEIKAICRHTRESGNPESTVDSGLRCARPE